MLSKLNGSKRERAERIKFSLVGKLPGICVERARFYTEAYEKFGSTPPILLRAKALAHYLENKTLYFSDDDLIPCYQASHPRFAPIFPEYSWEWILQDIDSLDTRSYDRFSISDKVKNELRSLLPRWKGKSVFEKISTCQPELVKTASEMGVTSWMGQATSGEGHIVLDFRNALETGLPGVQDRARKFLEKLSLHEPEDLYKYEFYQSVICSCDAVFSYIKRVEAFIGDCAMKVGDGSRQSELTIVEKTLRNIRQGAPSSFREALFVVWLLQLIQQIESNGHSVSLGRFDQYLFPFYKHDIDCGVLKREDALELIEHFFLKLFSIIKLRPERHTRTLSGYPLFQNLVISGQDSQGQDATNELSYLCLSALADIRLSEPNFYIRINDKTPDELLRDTVKVIRMGFGMPALVNDKIVVPSLERRGVTKEDALNYSTMGCLEVQVPGKWGYRANGKSKVNVLKILELAINDGVDPKTGACPKKGCGTLVEMENFNEVIEAWRKQLHYYTTVHVTADNINDRFLGEMAPNAFASAFVQDCMNRGKHINDGGAIYDMTSGALVGVPNVGNALAAIKKLVFEEKRISRQALMSALRTNFRTDEGRKINQMLLNKSPKYGEDDDYADELTAMVIKDYESIITKFKNMRYGKGPIGGGYYPSTVTISQNVPAGAYIGATADGRKNGEPTADGISPSQGTGRLGPTALLRSVSKLPTLFMTGGQLLNLRVTYDSLHSEEGIAKLVALIRSFFCLDGWHIQINTTSTDILRDAIKTPVQYKDLVVRVAGYSALFTSLDPSLQQDIISRLEHVVR